MPWGLVHRQKGADAVAGPVGIVDAGLPQSVAGQNVQFRTSRADREPCHAKADMALQHSGEPVAHLRCRLAIGDGAGDIGGPVDILPA